MRKLFAISLLALLLLASAASAWHSYGYSYADNYYGYHPSSGSLLRSSGGYYSSSYGGWSYTPYDRDYYSGYRSYSYPRYDYYVGERYYNPTNTWKSGTVYERQWRGYSQTFFMSDDAW